MDQPTLPVMTLAYVGVDGAWYVFSGAASRDLLTPAIRDNLDTMALTDRATFVALCAEVLTAATAGSRSKP